MCPCLNLSHEAPEVFMLQRPCGLDSWGITRHNTHRRNNNSFFRFIPPAFWTDSPQGTSRAIHSSSSFAVLDQCLTSGHSWVGSQLGSYGDRVITGRRNMGILTRRSEKVSWSYGKFQNSSWLCTRTQPNSTPSNSQHLCTCCNNDGVERNLQLILGTSFSF